MTKISNYHTHTFLCKHAEGIPAEYVQQARKEGCLELGFSDHVPYPESFNDYWPDIRMSYDQIQHYKDMIEDARSIAGFPVYFGFECEWDKNFESYYRDDLFGKQQAQYLVLGSHWVTEGSSHIYIADSGSIDKKLLFKYIDQTIQGMQSGFFKFIAHPDLFMAGYKEWDEEAEACSKAIIEASVDLKLPLEINGLGINKRRLGTARGIRYQYPYEEFWETAAKYDVKVLCNSDAHKSEDVIFNNKMARDFASRFGFKILERLEF